MNGNLYRERICECFRSRLPFKITECAVPRDNLFRTTFFLFNFQMLNANVYNNLDFYSILHILFIGSHSVEVESVCSYRRIYYNTLGEYVVFDDIRWLLFLIRITKTVKITTYYVNFVWNSHLISMIINNHTFIMYL